MEGDNPTIAKEAARQMDEMLKGVMPDTWMGHARIIVAGRDLSKRQKEKVLRVTRNVVRKEGYAAEDVAERVIDKSDY